MATKEQVVKALSEDFDLSEDNGKHLVEKYSGIMEQSEEHDYSASFTAAEMFYASQDEASEEDDEDEDEESEEDDEES